jgi:sec-independent protein translocase protein TatA
VLPEIGGALGKSIKAFKKATREPDEIDVTPKKEGSDKSAGSS